MWHCPSVSERWLGGALTNFRTIRNRMGRLEELEKIINSDEINTYSKKMQSALNREYRKIYRNLNGLRAMNRIPECLVIVDPTKERNAVKEAHRLGVTTVALIDTDSDPESVDLPIPGNDDGIRSIELILAQLADSIIAGRAENPDLKKAAQEKGEDPKAAAPPAKPAASDKDASDKADSASDTETAPA